MQNLSDYTGKVDPEKITICGISFTPGEFTNRTRAAWLDVVKEYDLRELQNKLQTEVLPKFSRATNIENDPRVKSISKRVEKLDEKHNGLLDLYATDDEPEDLDEKIEEVVARLSDLRAQLDEITEKVQDEMMGEAKYAEETVSSLMEQQDEARLYFAWKLAKAVGKTDLEFEEFYAQADSEDFSAAERYIEQGNVPWASLYTNRMQEKPKKNKTVN